jgi:hypothetical protein
MSDQRQWVDHCDHPEESYVGSFCGLTRDVVFDLYVYQSSKWYAVCLRYGDEHPEYASYPDIMMALPNSSECYGEQVERALKQWITEKLRETMEVKK